MTMAGGVTVEWTVSSEYLSYLESNVCDVQAGQCFGICSNFNTHASGEWISEACTACNDECVVDACSGDCARANENPAEDSEAIALACDLSCCEARGLDDCGEPVATPAPTSTPTTPNDDGTGYAPACRCVAEDDFPFWNLLVETDYAQESVDVEGAVAVGGDMDVSYFGVGVSLNDEADGTSWHARDGLRVGGSLTWTGGTVYHGATRYGGEVDALWVNFADGISQADDVADDVAADMAIARETSNKLSYNAWFHDGDDGEASFAVTCKTAENDFATTSCENYHPIVFDARGTVAKGSCDADENSHDTGIHYFTITDQQLADNTGGIYILHEGVEGEDGGLGAESMVVINVLDSDGDGALTVGNKQIWVTTDGATDGEIRSLANTQTVWNFNGFNSLHFSSVSWVGSILAPDADVLYDNGNYEGNLFARSFGGNFGEGHWFPPNIPECVQKCECTTPAPTPAPECPCIHQADFPWWNALVSGKVVVQGDIEGNLAAGDDIDIIGDFSLAGKIGRFSADCDGDAQGDCAYSAANGAGVDSELADGVSLMAGGAITWEGAGDVFAGAAQAKECSVALTSSTTCEQVDNIPTQLNYQLAGMADINDLLFSEGHADYEGWDAAPSVTLEERGLDGDALYITTSGLTAQPIGAHFFSIKASALAAAEAVHIDHATGDDLIVINVEDDMGGQPLYVNDFGFYGKNGVADENDWVDGIYSRNAEILNRQTIWNFESSIESIVIQAIGWRGSILAPNAAIHSCNNQILGSVYAEALLCDCNHDGSDQDEMCGELHYWPPHIDVDCVCPESYVAPTPAPEKSCIEKCFDESDFDPDVNHLESCAVFDHFIASGCLHCGSDEMTEYVNSCLDSACTLTECGFIDDSRQEEEDETTFADAVDEIATLVEEEILIPTEVTVNFFDCETVIEGVPTETTENELVRSFTNAASQCTGMGEGNWAAVRVEFDLSGGRRLGDASSSRTATISFTAQSTDQGTGEMHRNLAGSTDTLALLLGASLDADVAVASYTDNSVLCLETDDENQSPCTGVATVYVPGDSWEADPAGTDAVGSAAEEGESAASSGLSIPIVAGLAVAGFGALVAGAVALVIHRSKDKRVAKHLEMRSDGTVTRV